MIPTIGAMIGFYILFRCFETLLFQPTRYVSPLGMRLVMAAAVLLGLMTLFCLLGLLFTSQKS